MKIERDSNTLHEISLVLCSALPWIICEQNDDLTFNSFHWFIEKIHLSVWDALLNYNRIECHDTLKNLEKAHDVAYIDILGGFDKV